MIPALIPIVTSLLPSAIRIAEDLFKKDDAPVPGVSRGAEKKAFVMDLIEANVDVLERHDKLPALVKENRAIVSSMISLAVDAIVAAMKHERSAA